jgi:hypothetical protein
MSDIHVVVIFAHPAKGFARAALQTFEVNASTAQERNRVAGEIVAHNSDQPDMRIQTRCEGKEDGCPS